MDGWYSKVGRNEQHDIFNFYVKAKIVLHTYTKEKCSRSLCWMYTILMCLCIIFMSKWKYTLLYLLTQKKFKKGKMLKKFNSKIIKRNYCGSVHSETPETVWYSLWQGGNSIKLKVCWLHFWHLSISCSVYQVSIFIYSMLKLEGFFF